jgi:hypothetical protein
MKNNLLPLAFALLSTATLALGLFITFGKLQAQQPVVVLSQWELPPQSR